MCDCIRLLLLGVIEAVTAVSCFLVFPLLRKPRNGRLAEHAFCRFLSWRCQRTECDERLALAVSPRARAQNTYQMAFDCRREMYFSVESNYAILLLFLLSLSLPLFLQCFFYLACLCHFLCNITLWHRLAADLFCRPCSGGRAAFSRRLSRNHHKK